ncbi:hypothetical protein M422DRAFT_781129 [Sphaerobolus stellatus SS14]|uniref:Unplaced genomic scaffold SPHSTscaffold_79, whole genome shotgun sequence n=1 Tax=Sphaerobolus stellatus (strain SS14) TaxID=990650 RepID=A0A0C9VMJ7_SPHS4|nr:hypothetical protein M422DRAFT_781129 [Sphaerobolus stellatus SS14]
MGIKAAGSSGILHPTPFFFPSLFLCSCPYNLFSIFNTLAIHIPPPCPSPSPLFLLSLPMPTPSPFASPSSSIHSSTFVPDSDPHYEDIVRHEAFADGRDIFKDALSRGMLLDFRDGSAVNAAPFIWPLKEDGRKFLPEELHEAFAVYDIPIPCCLCSTQELTPEAREMHLLHIRICCTPGLNHGYVVAGCRKHENGCGIWLRLDELYYEEALDTKLYKRRHKRGPGIKNFYRYRSLLNPTIPNNLPDITAPTQSVLVPTLPSTTTNITTPSNSPNLETRHTSTSALNVRKSKGKGRAIPHFKRPQEGSADTPLIVSDDEEAPSTPTRKGPVQRTGTSCQIGSPDQAPRAQSNAPRRSTSGVQFKRRSRRNRPYQPSERFFGDTYRLHDSVETSLLGIRNLDIPLLTPQDRDFYLHELTSGGVSHDLMFMLIDRCDCGHYFMKDYLHQVHGPSCIDWIESISVARPICPLHPMASKAVEKICRRGRSAAAAAAAAIARAGAASYRHQAVVAGTSTAAGPSSLPIGGVPLLFPLSPTTSATSPVQPNTSLNTATQTSPIPPTSG